MQGLNIVVADDDLTCQQTMRAILESEQHQVTLTDNGEQLLQKLELTDFDLIIVDMNMPVLNGLEAIRLFRFMNPDKNHIPVIMVTANSAPGLAQTCANAGINRCLRKPLQPQKLFAAITELTGRWSAEKSHERKAGTNVVNLRQRHKALLLDVQVLDQLSTIARRDNFIPGLIDDYIKNTEKLMHEMKTCAAAGRHDDIAGLAHTLDGSSRTLGAEHLASVAEKLQQLVMQQDRQKKTQIRYTLKELETACSQTRAALLDYLQSHGHQLH